MRLHEQTGESTVAGAEPDPEFRAETCPTLACSDSDEQNLLLLSSSEQVDRLNADFYGRFSYPWRTHNLDRILDPEFERIMPCQSLGDEQHRIVPERPSIWVPVAAPIRR